MYSPGAFVETDLAALDWLLLRDPFVTLVSCDDAMPFATHLPVLYSRQGECVLLEGHWARPNPQVVHGGKALMIVHGPHAYVSPGGYPDKESAARVPTWNYAVAHLSGKLEASTEQAFLASIVDRLSQRHEGTVGSDWRYEHTDEAQRSQLRGIVGFRFVPERIELKFKLNQNHPPANVLGVAEALRKRPAKPSQEQEIAALMLDRLAQRSP